MEWSRIYVDVARNGDVFGAWVERFTEAGTNQAPSERTGLSAPQLVEYQGAHLFLLLLDIAIDGPLGYHERQGWQAQLDGQDGPFDVEKF
jgi:hypothetical protein